MAGFFVPIFCILSRHRAAVFLPGTDFKPNRRGLTMGEDVAIKIILTLLALWLGTLSLVWARHLSDDKDHHRETGARLQEQDARLERALGRLSEAVKGMQEYQTGFNLQVHGELAAIKALLQRKS